MAAGATYEPIATQTLGSAAASITFSSIPATYTDLRVVWTNYFISGVGNSWIQFNGDAGTNYSLTCISGNGTTVYSTTLTNAARVGPSVYSGPSSSTNPFATTDIFSYAGSTYKTVLSTVSADNNGSGWVERTVGLWRSTAAITSITLSANGQTFNAGTTATLYGIKAA